MCVGVLADAARHRDRVGMQRRHLGIGRRQRGTRVSHLGRGQSAGLGLEQQVDGTLASLVPSFNRTSGPAHALTRPR